MLDAQMKAQLKPLLARLTHDVELTASLDDSRASADMRRLLADLSALSARIRVAEDGGAPRRPSFTIGRPGDAARIEFAGLPLGHEFTSLVLALLHTGGVAPRIGTDQVESIKSLAGALRFEVYISLACQNCPDVVQALNQIAALNPAVQVTTIDGALFTDEVAQRQVMAVPSVFLDGQLFGQGRMSLAEVLARLDRAAPRREAAKLAAKAPFDMLIVGAGPAGAAAAVYAARKGIRTGLVAERIGGQTLDTQGIENYISVTETVGPKFAAALEQHMRAYPVDVMEGRRVAALTPAPRPADLATLTLDNGARLRARSIVLATGARWRSVDVPGEAEYRNRGVAYCPHCDGPLFKDKRVAVIGGGNSGVEAAIDLAGVAAAVSLLEFGPALRADAVLVERLRTLPNVSVHVNAQTTRIDGDGSRVTGLQFTDRADDASRSIALEGVFVQIGLVPNTDWLAGVVERNRAGEIIVDAKGATSASGIYAAGDATTSPFKQIVIAAGDGAKAALGAFEYLMRQAAPLALAA